MMTDQDPSNNKDQILAHFQELTTLDNIEECESLLESMNWNLEQAVQSYFINHTTLNEQPGNNIDIQDSDHEIRTFTVPSRDFFEIKDDEDEDNGVTKKDTFPISEALSSRDDSIPLSAFTKSIENDIFSNFKKKRLLKFNVEYKHKKIMLHIHDDQTVSKLKEMVSFDLDIPIDHFTLKGWKDKESKATNNTILSTLNLRSETDLFVVNTEKFHFQKFENNIENSHAKFELIITILKTNKTESPQTQNEKPKFYRLDFDSSVKFLEVKRAVAKLSDILVCDQEWWACNKNYIPEENQFDSQNNDLQKSNQEAKYFQDLLSNNLLYPMPLSILEPENLTLLNLRNHIYAALDPDNGNSKTIISSANQSETASNIVTSKKIDNSKLPYFKKKNDIKMGFVVTIKNNSSQSNQGNSSRACFSALNEDLETEYSISKKVKPSGDSEEIDDNFEENLADYENMNLDEEEDMYDNIIATEPERKKPLIPDECPDDEFMGTSAFVEEFSHRYGPLMPLFYVGYLEDAVKETLTCPARERRLLALYLHSDSNVFCNIFCSKTFCNENIVNFLASNFTVWPWDLTSKKRERRFHESCSKHLGSGFTTTICNSKKLPAFVIITRIRSINEVLGVIEGDSTAEMMLDRLVHYYEMFDVQRARDEKDEQSRDERERIKREQDAAYLASLQSDKLKSQRQTEENEKKLQASKLEREIIEQKKMYQKECLNNLPKEPDSSTPASQVTCIRFRFPTGEMVLRRFNKTDKLKSLIDFSIGNGYSIDEYKILSSWPRRDLTVESIEKSFEELKLFPQETVIIEQR